MRFALLLLLVGCSPLREVSIAELATEDVHACVAPDLGLEGYDHPFYAATGRVLDSEPFLLTGQLDDGGGGWQARSVEIEFWQAMEADALGDRLASAPVAEDGSFAIEFVPDQLGRDVQLGVSGARRGELRIEGGESSGTAIDVVCAYYVDLDGRTAQSAEVGAELEIVAKLRGEVGDVQMTVREVGQDLNGEPIVSEQPLTPPVDGLSVSPWTVVEPPDSGVFEGNVFEYQLGVSARTLDGIDVVGATGLNLLLVSGS